MLNKVTGVAQRAYMAAGLAVLGVFAAVPALADTVTGVADADVGTQWSQMLANLLATIKPIAIAAATIFVFMLGWKYGKKLFSTIAR